MAHDSISSGVYKEVRMPLTAAACTLAIGWQSSCRALRILSISSKVKDSLSDLVLTLDQAALILASRYVSELDIVRQTAEEWNPFPN